MCDLTNVMASTQKFDTFWNSGLHLSPWPKRVFSVVSVRLKYDWFSFEHQLETVNQLREHSEDRVIAFLREKLENNSLPSQTIKWFINFSPCRRCSDRITDFIQDAKRCGVDIKIDMRFPCLYKIRRPSCAEKSCSHYHRIEMSAHDSNLEGLRQLRSSGVTLRTFKERDWKDLAELLDVEMLSRYSGSSRHIEDQALKRDLQRLLCATSKDLDIMDLQGLLAQLKLQLSSMLQ